MAKEKIVAPVSVCVAVLIWCECARLARFIARAQTTSCGASHVHMCVPRARFEDARLAHDDVRERSGFGAANLWHEPGRAVHTFAFFVRSAGNVSGWRSQYRKPSEHMDATPKLCRACVSLHGPDRTGTTEGLQQPSIPSLPHSTIGSVELLLREAP